MENEISKIVFIKREPILFFTKHKYHHIFKTIYSLFHIFGLLTCMWTLMARPDFAISKALMVSLKPYLWVIIGFKFALPLATISIAAGHLHKLEYLRCL